MGSRKWRAGRREQGSGSAEQGAGSAEQGAGSGKEEAGSAEQEMESREQKVGRRKSGAGNREQEAGSRKQEVAYLVFGEREQRGEALATDGTHVVLGGAAVRLGVLAEAVLGEEGSGADVAFVVPFDEVGLLLTGTCGVTHTRSSTATTTVPDCNNHRVGGRGLPASSSPGRMLWSRSRWFCRSDSMV